MILFTNASILGTQTADIRIDGETITEIGQGLDPAGAEVIDATGLIALPGLVDLHTHLRQPGHEDAETVLSGTKAAAAGGFTCVHAMANTTPTQDTAGVVEQVGKLGKKAGYAYVQPVGAVTVGLKGEKLAELEAMYESRANVTMFSDDGMCVSDPVLMRRALEYVRTFGGVIAQHAQEPRLTEGAQMHEGEVSAEIGLAGWPAVAEESIIARDCLLAKHVGSRLHVLHVSTKGSVDIIRWAKGLGIDVTAEATPHHISLDHTRARTYDPRFKVNPPLRTDEDIDALKAGLADGTIDTIGTDHAPHPVEAKDCEWGAGAFGMTGLETALAVVHKELVAPGLLDWADVARVMSTKPAEIGRMADQGRPIAVGEPANLCFYNPDKPVTVRGKEQNTKSTNTPWEGMTLPGQVTHTVFRGRITCREGKVTE
ncbi:dihydroorotase [Flaviflexus salsibiostraticola]|uniref:Dihydroorotase n=1 Tax=Flaviflexus salsibiostraticola TaxID=1282737 RepID=A0A3S8Z7G0_9ACTO|nr:dihydroorotase [Flaviflexus salsibiostraticola]AZN29266.1 dihydroorotase [Flaviflexus salsibiostraticola]